jgi:hypothetical protein
MGKLTLSVGLWIMQIVKYVLVHDLRKLKVSIISA